MHCNSTRQGLLVLLSMAGNLLCHAFVSPARHNPFSRTAGRSIDTPAFLATNRKRRRKSSSEQSPSESPLDFDETDETLDGELPDFDLDDGEEPKPKKKVIVNPDEITAQMMGDTNAPVRSVTDLIKDRALESKFQFDDEGDSSVPNFVELAGSSRIPEPAPVGAKKVRQAERKAAAIASKEEEEQEENILFKVPFLKEKITDEKGDINAIKVCSRTRSKMSL
jgi:hypothetical protein